MDARIRLTLLSVIAPAPWETASQPSVTTVQFGFTNTADPVVPYSELSLDPAWARPRVRSA